jgi:hypothetical protein
LNDAPQNLLLARRKREKSLFRLGDSLSALRFGRWALTKSRSGHAGILSRPLQNVARNLDFSCLSGQTNVEQEDSIPKKSYKHRTVDIS